VAVNGAELLMQERGRVDLEARNFAQYVRYRYGLPALCWPTATWPQRISACAGARTPHDQLRRERRGVRRSPRPGQSAQRAGHRRGAAREDEPWFAGAVRIQAQHFHRDREEDLAREIPDRAERRRLLRGVIARSLGRHCYRGEVKLRIGLFHPRGCWRAIGTFYLHA